MRYTKAQVESIVRKSHVRGIRFATLFGFLFGMLSGCGVMTMLVGMHAVNIDFSKAEFTPFKPVPQVIAPSDVAVETATNQN